MFIKKHIKFPICIQHDTMDCGSACIKMVTDYYGQSFTLEVLKSICNPTREGVSLSNIAKTFEELGYNTIGGRLSIDRLINKSPIPCIIYWNQEHFVVLYKIKKNKKDTIFHIADPGFGILKYNINEFSNNWCTTESNGENKGIILAIEQTNTIKAKHNPIRKNNFLTLIPYFLKYKKYFALIFLGLTIISVVQLFFPFLTQAIVDIGINNNDIRFINFILIAQLILIFSKTISEFIQSWLILHISTKINISMISDFLIKLMKLPMGFFDTKLTGDLLQRFEDHKRVESFITIHILSLIYSVINIIIFGSVLLYLNFVIFIVFLIGSILYIGWLFLFMKKRRIIDYKNTEQQAVSDSRTYQLIHGMQETKLQGCSHRIRWDWEDIQVKLFEINILSLKLRQNQIAGCTFITEAKNIIITFLAAYSVIFGKLSIGMMLSIQYIIGQLTIPIEQVAQFMYNLQDTKISLERIISIIDKDEENKNRKLNNFSNNSNNNIIIKNVTFYYSGTNNPTLKNINLNINEGKTVAIVGASGSGKTTLLKLLLQYYKVNSGEILIDNINLNDINTNSWRQQCGVVMQDGFIFSTTIARNIAISDDIIDYEKLKFASKMANIEEFINNLPSKYNTIIGQEGRNISQGQKQRILIARAIYKMPKYLFLDEATNALDTINEKEITNNLIDFMKNRTVFIVAHRLSTVMNADQIIVLNKGNIIEKGNHNELIKIKGYYYNLIKNQLELGS